MILNISVFAGRAIIRGKPLIEGPLLFEEIQYVCDFVSGVPAN